MAYEMKDLGYSEYLKFCHAEGIEPVACEEDCKLDFLREFLTRHQIENAIWDKNGVSRAAP